MSIADEAGDEKIENIQVEEREQGPPNAGQAPNIKLDGSKFRPKEEEPDPVSLSQYSNPVPTLRIEKLIDEPLPNVQMENGEHDIVMRSRPPKACPASGTESGSPCRNSSADFFG